MVYRTAQSLKEQPHDIRPRLPPPAPSCIHVSQLRLLLLAAAAAAALSACVSPEPEPTAPTPSRTVSSATPSGATTDPTSPSADEAAILAANADQTRWMIDADVERLGALLDENFTAIHITGYEQSKAEWLDQIRAGQMAYHDVTEQSVSVEIDGDTAVLVKRNLVTATIYGTRGTWPLESTTTYAKTDGVWRPTSSRATQGRLIDGPSVQDHDNGDGLGGLQGLFGDPAARCGSR